MSQTEPVSTRGEQYPTDRGGFDRLLTFPLEQAVETQRSATLMFRNTVALQDRIRSQNLELAREMYSSSLDLVAQSMREMSHAVDEGSNTEPGPRVIQQTDVVSDGEQQM